MINLGDKKWGVKDSGLLAYKQVGSKFFNKDFDFTRSSDATYIDKNGVLKTQSLYNLLPYSNDFSQFSQIVDTTITANATTAPDGSLTASKIEGVGTWQLRHLISSTIGNQATISVWVKAVNDSEKNTFLFSLGGGSNSEIFTATSQWQRFEFTKSGIIGGFCGMVNSLSSNDADLYVWGMQVVLGSEPLDYQYTNGRVGIPRIDFSDGVGALLLEPQRTNLVLYSEQFDNAAWSKAIGTLVTSNASLSPSGLNDADLVYGTNFNVSQNISATSGTYIFSVYLKATGTNIGKEVAVRFQNAPFPQTSIITNGDWQRVSVSITIASTTTLSPRILIFGLSNPVSEILAWGAQLEEGSYSTSIIETTTTQVTRLADVCNNSGSAQDFNSEEGVLYAEVSCSGDNGNIYSFISINNRTSATDFVAIGFRTDTEKLFLALKANGSVVLVDQNIPFNFNQVYKIAIKYKSGESAFFIDGVKVVSNTSAFTLGELSELEFNYHTASNNPFYGKVRNLQVFTEALSDAELISLTT